MAPVQIVGLRVRVVHAPAGHDFPALVGLVIAVGVLEEKETWRLGDHDAAVGKGEAGRDVQPVGEDREFVGPAVAVGVLADLDAVVAEAVGFHVVRVVARLGDPEAAALVPRHEDRFGTSGSAAKSSSRKSIGT